MFYVSFRGDYAEYCLLSSDSDEVLRFVTHVVTHSLFCPEFGINISYFSDPSDVYLLDLGDIEEFDSFLVYAKYDDFDYEV